ncbi:MAG TPA: DUF1345 domain-containing protein [Caulobacteraceae bacterium]
MTPLATPNLLRRRWRMLLALPVGIGGATLARLHGLPPGLSSLIGWNAATVVFLTTTIWMLLRDDEGQVRARAAYEDEGQTVTMVIILSAVVAGLGATVVAMHESKAASAHTAGAASWAWILSVSTLVLGWMVVQSMFTLRYAHRYFGDNNADGEVDGGIRFPGEPPRTYHDFIYAAVCVGATAQVSDFSITTASFRRLITQHALLAFFFNTMVLALGINILASVIGQ